MNPSTHSTSLKKIHYFYKAQPKVIFILFIFHSNFHFLDFILADSFYWVLRLCYKIWSWLHIIVLPQLFKFQT